MPCKSIWWRWRSRWPAKYFFQVWVQSSHDEVDGELKRSRRREEADSQGNSSSASLRRRLRDSEWNPRRLGIDYRSLAIKNQAMIKPPLSRRRFIGNSMVMAAGAMAFSRASYASILGANDRIRFAVIGCGGMGTGHLGSLVKRSDADNIKVVAVYDVYQRRLTRAKGICQGEGYSDYRKLLERQDIDTVLIATPDHWQARISMEAMESGKHVYVEM